MFRKIPPLHSLTAFECAARHQSFAKAAEELFLTHSAVSHRIRVLEEHVGTQLFLRMNKQVVLTSKGTIFLETVRDILVQLQAASARLRHSARSLLRISVLPAFAAGWLIQRVGDFHRLHPDIELEFQSTQELVSLKARQADVAIRFGAGEWPGLVVEKLFDEWMFPVASPEYLEQFGEVDSPERLEGAVLLRHRLLTWKPWFEVAGLSWAEPAVGPLYSDLGLMLEAAVCGQGIALARSSLIAAHLKSGRLLQLTDFIAPSEWSFYLAYAPEAAVRPEVMQFAAWILDAARNAPPVTIPATLRLPPESMTFAH